MFVLFVVFGFVCGLVELLEALFGLMLCCFVVGFGVVEWVVWVWWCGCRLLR